MHDKKYSGRNKYMDTSHIHTSIGTSHTRTNMDTSHTGTGFGGISHTTNMAMASIMMAMAKDHSYGKY